MVIVNVKNLCHLRLNRVNDRAVLMSHRVNTSISTSTSTSTSTPVPTPAPANISRQKSRRLKENTIIPNMNIAQNIITDPRQAVLINAIEITMKR
jgi:hypothetical protein